MKVIYQNPEVTHRMQFPFIWDILYRDEKYEPSKGERETFFIALVFKYVCSEDLNLRK